MRTIKYGDVVRRLAAVGVLLLAAIMLFPMGPTHALAGPSAAPPQLAPLPSSMARLWIYREYEPYESLATPYVRLNGAIIGVSQPGGAFYRDVAPGTYQVTVDSIGMDVNQFVTVTLAPGEQAFIKVLVSNSWDSGGRGSWARDTFYTWQIQPQAAEAEIARLPLYSGG